MPDLSPDPAARRPPAPGTLEKVVREGRRRRRRGAAAAAVAAGAVVVAAGVVLVSAPAQPDELLTGQQPSPTTSTSPSASPTASPSPVSLPPVECPVQTDAEALVVPAGPTGFDGDARLVPEEVPARVTICRYESGSGTLAGSRQLEGDLSRVPDDLHLPRKIGDRGPCTLVGGPRPPYLVRLDYADGAAVWVVTKDDPNSCEDVTNGSFTSTTYVGTQLAESFEAGVWARPPAPRGSCVVSSNRAGQELALLPEGWTSLRVCADQPVGTGREVPREDADRIAGLLQDLSTFPGSTGASCDGGADIPGGDRTLHLAWSYPSGRDVWVILFAGCDPPLTNGSLSANAGGDLQRELLRILQEE